MGADMRYECLGNNKYKIIATLYRDCRGVTLNNLEFGVYAGNNHGWGCGFFDITGSYTRTTMREVTPLCDTAKGRCNPANTNGTGAGVEEHIYEATIDFTKAPFNNFKGNSSCCDVTFYVTQCCRNGAITTGPAGYGFITNCSINLCNLQGDCNTSAFFSNRPIFFAACNQPYVYNHGPIDTMDQDSLGFEITTPLAGIKDSMVKYANPYSFNLPLTPYCPGGGTIKCTPNPAATTPIGFYLNPQNAEMIFTPTKCDETTVMSFMIKEYRKAFGFWKEVGSVRRDMQMSVTDAFGYNNPPKIKGKNSYCVEEGDSLDFNITTLDTLFTPNQSVGDSVTLNWNAGIKGATFSTTHAKNPTGTFGWRAPKGSARSFAYNFSVHAIDNNCPLRAEAYKGFQVYVGSCSTRNLATKIVTKPNIRVYPQPVKAGGVLHLPDAENGTASILDICGRQVFQLNINSNTAQLPNHLNAGYYLLQINNAGKLHTVRICIED